MASPEPKQYETSSLFWNENAGFYKFLSKDGVLFKQNEKMILKTSVLLSDWKIFYRIQRKNRSRTYSTNHCKTLTERVKHLNVMTMKLWRCWNIERSSFLRKVLTESVNHQWRALNVGTLFLKLKISWEKRKPALSGTIQQCWSCSLRYCSRIDLHMVLHFIPVRVLSELQTAKILKFQSVFSGSHYSSLFLC